MLKSFVSEEDYPKLINILKRIYNKTLKDDVSILNIYGSVNSGKTTLCTIMATIGNLKRISNINFTCASPKFIIDALKDDAVLVRDANFENILSFPEDITLRERYHSETIQIENHATFMSHIIAITLIQPYRIFLVVKEKNGTQLV